MREREYRIIWQREGKAKQRVFRQTLAGAQREVERQRTAAEEMTWTTHPIPPIVYGPVIEWRAVGAWEPL